MANKNTLNRANEFSLFWAAASRPERCGERGGGLVKVCTKRYFFRIKGSLAKVLHEEILCIIVKYVSIVLRIIWLL